MQLPPHAPRVALVSDEATFAAHVARDLMDAGDAVATFGDGRRLLPALRAAAPDVVVLEGRMESGILAAEVVDAMRRDDDLRSTPVIVCSADHVFLHAYGQHVVARACALIATPRELGELAAHVARLAGGLTPLVEQQLSAAAPA